MSESMLAERPSREELVDAITKAKQHGMKSTDIKHTDRGAQMVRHLLNEKWARYPLDDLRVDCENLSKSGREPGQRKRSLEQRVQCWVNSLLRAYPVADAHSEQYNELHASQEYKDFRDSLKRSLDFHCQLCAQGFNGTLLEGHIWDYKNWKMPGRMLILCKDCHPVADALKRRGAAIVRGEEVLPMGELFSGEASS